ncbi:hypothetical protein R1flu_001296 [Riccia fluitans]|uniref:Golgin-84 n=1 Tax=Riccia fluitans TaxID=41844 RepID=A0ABD1Y384_9MARC
MANWLSSRLKAAEQLLQQIDQQAAATLQKDRDGGQREGFGVEKTPEKRSQSARKEKESYGIASTSDDGFGLSRGRGKLLDRPLQPSKPGGGRKFSSEERQQRTPAQKTSKASPSISSQSKIPLEAREDWSELLGSPDLVGTSLSRPKSSDFDTHTSALKPSRTKVKSSGLTPSSRTSSNGDLHTLTPAKATQITPTKDPPKISQASSCTTVEKAGTVPDGREVVATKPQQENGDEQEIKAIVEEPILAGEAVHLDSSKLSKDIENTEEIVEEGRNLQGVRSDRPMEKGDEVFSTVSDSSEVKEPQQADGFERKVPEADSSGTELRTFSYDVKEEDESSILSVRAEELNQSDECAQDEIPSEEGVVELAEDSPGTSIGPSIVAEHGESNVLSDTDAAEPHHEEGDSFTQNDAGHESEEEEILSVESGTSSEVEESSDSGTDRSSDSEDSDYEEKRRARKLALRKKLARRRVMEARAAAEEAARVAVREREDLVERLQREKDSLEALLAEGEEQHVKMAAELRQSMVEVVQLLEQEKQLHNNTRRQALELEVKLEAENAELAKSLAASQWELDEITSKVCKIRTVVEAKLDACSDLEREAALLRIRLSRPHRSQRAIDDAYEAESMEEEKSRMTARIEQLRVQAEDLQDSLKRLQDRQVAPSSMQLELESQLAQITDSLIHKQAQVEELSTEKATLIFRVEAVSNTLREEKLALTSRAAKRNPSKGAWADWSTFDDDLEYGYGKVYSAKEKAWDSEDFRHDHLNVPYHFQPFLRLIRQVDALVMGGALVLRRSGMARAFAGLYLLALHWWVIFILFSHPATTFSDNVDSASVFSAAKLVQSTLNESTTSFE